jgi:hypothetical protein
MQKTLVPLMFFAFLLLSAIQVQSQNRLGFIAGANIARISFDPDNPDYERSNRTGLEVGTFFERRMGNNIELHFESRYVEKGSKSKLLLGIDTLLETTLKLSYIESATFLKLLLSKGKTQPYFAVGPSISFLIDSRRTDEVTYGEQVILTQSRDLKDNTENVDLGLEFAGGVRFNYFFIEGRYSLGLTTVFKVLGGSNGKNRGVQIISGVAIPIR